MIRGSCGQARKQKCELSIGAGAGGDKGSWGLCFLNGGLGIRIP